MSVIYIGGNLMEKVKQHFEAEAQEFDNLTLPSLFREGFLIHPKIARLVNDSSPPELSPQANTVCPTALIFIAA
ncbi:MAG: hypothetical protein QNJ70_05860, partial [Xenococcaceae cyanobacterium MO_207.B15]|nr:hypothetical protein [Xenococcaceae cyanobacterium MO_207.B15]